MKRIVILVSAVLLLASCSTQMKMGRIRKDGQGISLSLTENDFLPDIAGNYKSAHKDTLTVHDDEGNELIIMKAIRDENGEMVVNDVIDAAVVTAKFRNIAERNGKVDLRFQVSVPPSMLDSRWQLRLTPEMTILDRKMNLEPVIITGKGYRRAQMKGYQQYERFLNSIITDSTRFVRLHELEVFIKRNMPELYDLKTDSTYVSDEQFASIYGVTERQAVDHYTNQMAAEWNRRKIERKDKMFDRYVKVPILTEGLRLDTVMTDSDGGFVYEYIQTISTVPELRKVDISMYGGIFEEDKTLYDIPAGGPITFYISSLSSLCADNERFLTKIVEQKAVANSTCWIEFRQGGSEIEQDLGNNRQEIGRIKENLASLLENEEFDMDSIIVTASCSPEGTYESNDRLSLKRSSSVSSFFKEFIRQRKDSLASEAGMFLSLGDGDAIRAGTTGDIPLISRNIPENWERMISLVGNDEVLNDEELASFNEIMKESRLDIREERLSGEPYYHHLREVIYPRLRTVRFDFHLHRKGMIKDTLHTTVTDTTYMRGLQAIKDRDYKTAVTLLRPYEDYNSAVAFICMDYNESALSILEKLERTASVNYLLAIAYSRKEMIQEAVQCYLDACRMDQSYIHRGNLDPEISGLIKQYDLNLED